MTALGFDIPIGAIPVGPGVEAKNRGCAPIGNFLIGGTYGLWGDVVVFAPPGGISITIKKNTRTRNNSDRISGVILC